jgi:hypothetical protein
LNDEHSNYFLAILEITMTNQDNKGQPQQGGNSKPDQQTQQPGQNPGQQTQQPDQKPAQKN